MTFVHISHLISKIISWDKHTYSNLTVDSVGESKHLTPVCTTINLLSLYLSLGLSDVNRFHKISWPAPNCISCVSFLKYRRYSLEMAWFYKDEAAFAWWAGTLVLAVHWHGCDCHFCPLNSWVPFSKFINFSGSLYLWLTNGSFNSSFSEDCF